MYAKWWKSWYTVPLRNLSLWKYITWWGSGCYTIRYRNWLPKIFKNLKSVFQWIRSPGKIFDFTKREPSAYSRPLRHRLFRLLRPYIHVYREMLRPGLLRASSTTVRQPPVLVGLYRMSVRRHPRITVALRVKTKGSKQESLVLECALRKCAGVRIR